MFAHNIYITINDDWYFLNKCKYGYVSGGIENLVNRINDSTEQHSELSKYTHIFEIKSDKYILPYVEIDKIFSLFTKQLNSNSRCDKYPLLTKLKIHLIESETKTSNEFIKLSGVDLIEQIIQQEFPLLGLKLVKQYSKDELDDINRSVKLKYTTQNPDTFDWTNFWQAAEQKNNLPNSSLVLRDYQTIAIEKARQIYTTENNSILNWACGLGKTLTSLYIARLYTVNKLIIGIPSNILLDQWFKIISYHEISIGFKFLIVSSKKINVKNYTSTGSCLITTTKIEIENFLNSNEKVIVLTTYHSSHKLTKYVFDFGIFDECHHLCGIDLKCCDEMENETVGQGKFTDMLKIKCKKTISLSATLKQIVHENKLDNFNVDIFGKLLDEKSVKWAIENKYITDYRFITLRMNINDINLLISELNLTIKNIELFLSAYITIVQAMMNYNKIDKISHILVYCNSVKSAKLVTDYINQILLSKYPNHNKKIYNKTLSSNQSFDLDNEMKEYKESDIGIISCVYIFGEGFDDSYFNTCTIAEKMISTIRLIQSLLRANRLDPSNKNKIANYICPFIDSKTKETKLCSFTKVKDLLVELHNIDNNVFAKIKYAKMSKSKSVQTVDEIRYNNIDFDKLETNTIKMLIRHRRVLQCDNWDKNEYSIYQRTNIKHKITSVYDYENSKHAFEEDGLDFIQEPEKYFTGKSSTIWSCMYDFLGVDTSIFPPTKEELKEKCLNEKITSKTYVNLYKKYNLPENPGCFYKDFKNMEYLLDTRRIRKLRS
jgi:superfamily II DNA or RNA helicase